MSTLWQLHKMEELRPHMLLHIRLGQQVLPCYRTWVQISVYAAAWFQMTEAITLNGSLLEQMPILGRMPWMIGLPAACSSHHKFSVSIYSCIE